MKCESTMRQRASFLVSPATMEPHGVNRTFFVKFRRRRRKMSSILSSSFVCVALHLFILLIAASSTLPVHCLPFLSPQSDTNKAGPSSCDIGFCINGVHHQQVGSAQPSRQPPNLASMSCPQLKALHSCLKNQLSNKCFGDLNFHTLTTMVKNSKKRCREQKDHHHKDSSSPPSESPPSRRLHHSPPATTHSRPNRHHHSAGIESPVPIVRSGDAFNIFNQLAKAPSISQPAPQPPPAQPPSPPLEPVAGESYAPKISLSDQYCMAAAYNYTIGVQIVSSGQYAAAAKSASSVQLANPEEHHLYKSSSLQSSHLEDLRLPQSYHLRLGDASLEDADQQPDEVIVRRNTLHQQQPSSSGGDLRRRRLERSKRDSNQAAVSEYVRSVNEAVGRYLRSGVPKRRDSSVVTKSESQQQLQSAPSDILNLRQSRDTSTLGGADQQGSSPPKITDLVYRPVQPPSPSLTCIIFGDPHIRTFDSRYQTCNCIGARSLIEHPLFDVQITNTRLQEQFNATGVTKVTVLVRQFAHCSIGSDLIYETDSLNQDLPSATFVDGSTHANRMIYISTSSENSVVTVHLDHIGVRVYISQFVHTKFLNVVIKFRTATSTVNQNLVLNAISEISLCKSGCHPRELVNLESVLKSAGVDTSAPARGTRVGDPDVKTDSSDESTSAEEVDTDEEEELDPNDKSTSEDEDDEEYIDGNQYDDEDEDDDNGEDEGDSSSGHDLPNPQVPPRGKRVKKDSQPPQSEATEDNAQNRKKDRKNRNRDRKNKERNNRNKNRDSGALPDAMQSFQLLRPAPSQQLPNSDGPSLSRPAPPLPLFHQIGLQPSEPSTTTTTTTTTTNRPPAESADSINQQLVPSGIDLSLQPPTPSLTDECNEMKGYYRLTCLYDTVLKGISSTYPHKFAASFDEPRLLEDILGSQQQSGDGHSRKSHSPSSALTSGPSNLLIFTSCFSFMLFTIVNFNL